MRGDVLSHVGLIGLRSGGNCARRVVDYNWLWLSFNTIGILLRSQTGMFLLQIATTSFQATRSHVNNMRLSYPSLLLWWLISSSWGKQERSCALSRRLFTRRMYLVIWRQVLWKAPLDIVIITARRRKLARTFHRQIKLLVALEKSLVHWDRTLMPFFNFSAYRFYLAFVGDKTFVGEAFLVWLLWVYQRCKHYELHLWVKFLLEFNVCNFIHEA